MLVDHDPLVLGPVPIDSQAEGSVVLTNRNRVPVPLELSLDGPGFSLLSEVAEVPVDGQVEIRLGYAPLGGEPVSGTLWLTSAQAVALQGLADPDGDDDGAAHPLAGGGDCDDTDPDIGPDVPETWYDGIDQDCDGNDDDADRDGSPVAEDCDDQDAARAPEHVETWYDGIDQDCDGNDDDADYDGYAGQVLDEDGYLEPGEDCDDLDPAVNPSQDDAADGVDQDCDGIVDEDDALPGVAMLSELFPENPYKTSGSDEYLELWVKDGRALTGWVLASGSASGVITQHAPAGTTWLLLCSEGLRDDQPDCGATVEPWPRTDRQDDTLQVSVDGLVVDVVTWGASWGLQSGPAQLDLARLASGSPAESDNDEREAWCGASGSPGSENEACP